MHFHTTDFKADTSLKINVKNIKIHKENKMFKPQNKCWSLKIKI